MKLLEYTAERSIITLSYEPGTFLYNSTYLHITLLLLNNKKHSSKIGMDVLDLIDSAWIERYESLIIDNYFTDEIWL
ncbi:hypothetical protein [Aliivibrio logei]|jgi:hypothetical protein|uniref:hypothetical protein n=1 Tax=Aliivibrio logei TaxID=688 RepID=UPI0035C8A290